MNESSTDLLERKRFVVSEASLGLMKRLKADLPLIQKEIPQIQGLGFFGSRTLSQEEASSDLDLVVFYDGSAFPADIDLNSDEDIITAGLVFRNGRLVFDKDKLFQRKQMTLIRKQFEGTIQNRYVETIAQQVPTDRQAQRRSTLITDISEAATDRGLRAFVDEMTIKSPDVNYCSDNTVRLISRFFLSVGDSVYQNRRYIFDRLEAVPKGEYYFQLLMGYLASFERTRDALDKKRKRPVPYMQYPQTIQEGKDYFLHKPY